MADVAGSDPALANCRPDWTATQDLSLYGAGWLTEGPVVGDHRLVPLGKRVVVVSVDLYDGHGMDDFAELESELDDGGGSATGRLTLAARTRASVVRDAGDHCVVVVELVDAGAEDRLGARATVTLQRPPT